MPSCRATGRGWRSGWPRPKPATPEVALRALAALAAVDRRPFIVTDEVLTLLALSEVQVRSGQYRAALGSASAGRAIVEQHSPDGGLLQRVGRAEGTDPPSAQGMPCAPSVCFAGCRARPTSCSCEFGSACFAGRVVAAQMLREVEPATPRQEAEHALLSAWSQLGRSRRASEQHLLALAEVCVANGLTTSLVGAPPDVLGAARRAADHFVDDGLLGLVDVAERARGPRPAMRPAPEAASAALSRGELQLVALLPTRMTNADMADRLGVSVNTVKTRLRRLFAKLDVHDRRHAVERAGELGLLPESDQTAAGDGTRA